MAIDLSLLSILSLRVTYLRADTEKNEEKEEKISFKNPRV